VKLEKKDLAVMALISAIFFSVAVFNLGFTRIPETAWQVEQETIYVRFDQNKTLESIYFLVNTDQNITGYISVPQGQGWSDRAWFNNGGYYKWLNLGLNATTNQLKMYFYHSAGEILEIVAVDSSHQKININSIQAANSSDTGVTNLIDEQQYFEYPPTIRSETAFDEVLFVKAAQEYLHLQEPTAEATHPPLGKLIIAAGIDVFSFNPFGWRILDTVFATLMIPIIYMLGLAIFKARFAAIIASAFLSLDFMHFTMARIGTVDTFLVFFTLLSTLFFYLNFEKMTLGGKPDYKLILLGIVSFYLAFSVKWTAIFALIGQVLLFFAAALAGSASLKESLARLRSLIRPMAVIFGLLAAGGLIYLATFIPYAMIGHGLADIYNAQWSMLSYHESMSHYIHPSASNWYEWPLTQKPLYLYLRELPNDMISTVSAMGNPVVWWVGLCAVLIALVSGLKKEWPFLFVGVLFLAQLLPYALIPRYLFIYHYYLDVPILALATGGVLNDQCNGPRGRRLVALLFVIAIALFAIFYPVISGYPIPQWYTSYLHWFRDWIF
jgi:dolichyl-phosphate-mannose-protein mannosyltransferase